MQLAAAQAHGEVAWAIPIRIRAFRGEGQSPLPAGEINVVAKGQT
jgi:hypothetical protein